MQDPSATIQYHYPKKRRTRRGKRKRKVSSEADAGAANDNTLLRRAKRSKTEGSGSANRKRIEKRTRQRRRKRLEKEGKEYKFVDPWTRIKFGPRAFDPEAAEPTLPSCLRDMSNEQIFFNEVLDQVLKYFHSKVLNCKCGEITIEWSNETHRKSGGECVSKKNEHSIRLNPCVVTTKLQIYLTVAHELAHAYVAATSCADDTNHGNPFIKALEKFLEFDEKMDVYMPIRASPQFKKFIYECADEECGKMYVRNTSKKYCSRGEDLLCYIKDGLYVHADEFLQSIEESESSSDSNAEFKIED